MCTENEYSEKRHFQRILFDAPVLVALGSSIRDSHLMDISLKGALIRRPPDWTAAAGDEARLTVMLQGEDARIEMDTRVAHSETDRIGLQCIHIDMDSITHLRRLVELNLGDETQLQRELEELM